jgi:hypothetical protein
MRRIALPLTTAATALCLFALGASTASAAAPLISHTTFSHVGTETATLEATLDPQGKATKYHFEYGTIACSEEPDPCTALPEPPQIPGASPPLTVSAELKSLAPGANYHFRLIAKNNDGEVKGPDTPFATYRPPSAFGPCPANEALRSGHPSAELPDCRAYEQVTPTDKNGGDARGRVAFVRASPGGQRITFAAVSPVPGAVGTQSVPTYLSARSGGWSTSGLLPPETLGEEAFVRGWTPDLTQVFEEASRFSQVGGSTFLSRSSADGSLDAIVDYDEGLTPSANLFYAGASADGSKVLFESTDKLATVPAAIQGKSNLYLWDRESGQISLAGVMNDQATPPQGAFAGPYDWTGAPAATPNTTQGGAAAAYYTQDTHAVSADGSVYFTAAKTGQLYLRRNPTEPQSAVVVNGSGEEECTEPAKACTLHLSASEKDDGGGPNGTDAAGTRPAAFMGASADGSVVLFTSSEKLTDDANTGPEPTGSPAIARANLPGGSGKDLGFLPAHANGVAVFGGHIYWADPEDGTIGRAKLNGAGPPTEEEPEFIVPGPTEFESHPVLEPGILHSAPSTPRYVAVDSGHVYWTNTGPLGGEDGSGKKEEPLDGAGTIGRATLDLSGQPEEVKPAFITGASNPQGIAVDAGHIYWANAARSAGNGCNPPDCTGGEPSLRTISRADLEGENVELRFDKRELVADGLDIPQAVAVDATHLFATANGSTEAAPGYVERLDLEGNTAGFFPDPNNPANLRGIAVDGSHVYFARSAGNAIGRQILEFGNESGASAEPGFIEGAGQPQGLALDGEHIYWAANQEVQPNPGNDLYRFDAKSGALTDLTVDTNPGDAAGAAVVGVLGISEDASYVYFAANGDLDGVGPAQGGDCKGTNIHFTGQCSLYLEHGGAISFVARLDANPGTTGSDATDWLPHGGTIGQVERTARVSPDGQTLLFRSRAKLSAYDNESFPELYLYRLGQGVVCVSCDPSGEPPSVVAFGRLSLGAISFPNASTGLADPSFTLTHNLSADGSRVFFETADALLGEDTDGQGGCPIVGASNGNYPSCLDVYEWEAQGTGSCEEDVQGGGCLYLLSRGTGSDASFIADADEAGHNVFFFTRDSLVLQDQDQLFDIYDARIDGGLASQNELPPAPCEAEGCRPAPSAPPGAESPGSAAFSGPANPKPKAARHKKHKRHAKHPHKRPHRRGAKSAGRTSR